MNAGCPECRYLQEERAGILEFEGKAPRWEAERRASKERCVRHREFDSAAEMGMWARRRFANGGMK